MTTPSDLVRSIRAQAPDGLLVLTRSSGTDLTIPSEVRRALIGASAEALRNVARHSGVHVAHVCVRSRPHSVSLTISDHGRGLGVHKPRFGLNTSIISRLDEIGGAARIVSHARSGTTVRLEWPERRHRQLLPLARAHGQTRRALHEQPVTLRAGAALLASNVFVAVWQIPQSSHVIGFTALAAALVAIASAVLKWVPTCRPTWSLIGLLACCETALAMTEIHMAGPGALVDFRSWSLALANFPMVVLALYCPARALPLLIAPVAITSLVTVAAESQTELAPALGSILSFQLTLLAFVIGSVLRTGLRRNDRRQAILADLLDHETRIKRTRNARASQLKRTLEHTVPWLERIAGGEIDVGQQCVRDAAEDLSRETRDELYLPGFFDDDLRAIVRAARTRGCHIDIREGFAPGAYARTTGAVLYLITPHLTQGSRLTLTPAQSPADRARLVVKPALRSSVTRLLDTSAGAWLSAMDDAVSTVVVFHDLPRQRT